MDALSEALKAVRMTGAVFFNAEFTAPWGFAEPPARDVAHVLAPGTERLVIYHLITDGKARASIEDTGEMSVSTGDVVIVPHGDPHAVWNGSPPALTDPATTLRQIVSGDLSIKRQGGGGEATRIVCG